MGTTILEIQLSKPAVINLEQYLPFNKLKKDNYISLSFCPLEYHQYFFEPELTMDEITKIGDKLLEMEVDDWEFQFRD